MNADTPKTERMGLRLSAADKRLLQAAAAATGQGVSAFVRDAATAEAARVLADRRQIVLDEAQWQAFERALLRPVRNKPRLQNLLGEVGVLG